MPNHEQQAIRNIAKTHYNEIPCVSVSCLRECDGVGLTANHCCFSIFFIERLSFH